MFPFKREAQSKLEVPMKYSVEIREILSRVMEIEADSSENAYNAVQVAYRNSDIVHGSEAFICCDFRLITDTSNAKSD